MAVQLKSTNAFGSSESGDSTATGSGVSGSKKGYSKGYKSSKFKGKNAEGLTPEQVHEIRYSGIRLDTTSDVPSLDEDGPVVNQNMPLSDSHFHVATREAEKAVSNYRILLTHEIREKLIEIGKTFEDLGMELFAVMHMMHAFMGKRPDHAPIEVTAFRLRLGAGVERGTCHFFPSPMPIPFGKTGDYNVGRKELHEIEEESFKEFNDDFVDMFRTLLFTLQPKAVLKRNLSSFAGKFPLIICQSFTVNHVIMMFEYLHQRALLAQKAKLPTKAPDDFIVPESIPLAFCEIRNFNAALKDAFRVVGLVADPQDVDSSQVHHCAYHKTTNKLSCTTYVATDILEQILAFSYYWAATPARLLDPSKLSRHVDASSLTMDNTPKLSALLTERNSNTGSRATGDMTWSCGSDTPYVPPSPASSSSNDDATDETSSEKSSVGNVDRRQLQKPRALMLRNKFTSGMATPPGPAGSTTGSGSVVSSGVSTDTQAGTGPQPSILVRGRRSRIPPSLDLFKPKKDPTGEAVKSTTKAEQGDKEGTSRTVPTSVFRSSVPQ